MATNNVLINNLCSWPLSFRRQAGMGEVEIPGSAHKYALLSFEEIQAQIQVGNVMFTGTDGMGSHARIQIIDDDVRRQLFGIDGIDTDAPVLLELEAVRALLSIKTKGKFNEQLQAMVKTDAEKKMLVELAKQAGSDNAESWKVDALRELAETAGI